MECNETQTTNTPSRRRLVHMPNLNGNQYTVSQDEAGRMVLSLQGRLDVSNAAALIAELTPLVRDRRPAALVVDLARLDYCDDFGVAMLVGLKKAMAAQQGDFVLTGLNDRINRILAVHRFDTLGQPLGRTRRTRADIFTRLGEATLDITAGLNFVLSFLGNTVLSLLHVCRQPRLLRLNDTLDTMQRVGVDALPIVGLISFLLGLIMAFISAVQLQQFGANIYVASLVSLSMTRELGPIMTAIIVAGRSGSAFAAEIGSMKLSEEVDALFTMGIDPHIFLVIPRLLASVLMVPFLTLFADVFAIAGGLLVGVGMLDLTVSGYINQTINTLDLFDVFWGFSKAGVFALLVAWTGCLRGFQVRGGAAGVGRATTSAVVTGIFLIIMSDSILVVILRYWQG
jgi:phospholipid/cholesterol/gamma-HCH transport system permease protein